MERMRQDAIKGRGAVSNPTARYEGVSVEPFDDGWGGLEEEPDRPATEVTEERTRHIIATNDSPDIPFNQSINPYKGCEHGCIYCFARPTHAYLGLSPGLDFETRIVAKPDAAEVLERQFRRAGYRPQPIALGANTDPYQPVEAKRGITRQILETLRAYGHPLTVVTKSAMVLRDLDVLAEMAERRLAHVYVSLTTLDRQLARRMEPRAASPSRRVEVIRALSEAGIPVGVLASPIIPALNDHELEAILEAASEAGAKNAGWIMVRLPGEVAGLFTAWLETHYPDRAAHVLSLIRGMRGGNLNTSTFGERMGGSGPYGAMVHRRFESACARLGLSRGTPPLDTTQFCLPAVAGDQLDLL